MEETFEFKDKYKIDDLLKIMSLLRSENGCPWDKEQTHQSIRKNFIEETYEVIEAIDNDDKDLLLEELGDVLLQIVFHCQIEKECGNFDFSDVTDRICKKLIARHPHIFGDVKVRDTEQVLENWNNIKKAEKQHKNQTEVMNSVPRVLPSLMRSAKVQQKAADVGFDWDNVKGALDKLEEEIRELKEAIDRGDGKQQFEEFGDLLFAAVNVSRFLGVDAEKSLTYATDKFIRRFSVIEKLALKSGIEMKNQSIEVLDELWEKAKEFQ